MVARKIGSSRELDEAQMAAITERATSLMRSGGCASMRTVRRELRKFARDLCGVPVTADVLRPIIKEIEDAMVAEEETGTESLADRVQRHGAVGHWEKAFGMRGLSLAQVFPQPSV